MDSQNINSETPAIPSVENSTLQTPNKNSFEKVITSTPAKRNPSATNRLNFKQSKPNAPYNPKHASSLLGYPLIPDEKSEIVASSPFTTLQNAQKYIQYPMTTQSASQRGSISRYLVHSQRSMMNSEMQNEINFPTNSM